MRTDSKGRVKTERRWSLVLHKRPMALPPTPLEPTLAAGSRFAMLLGTEGDGLSSRWLAEADLVRIPISPAVDSLNVAAAAAVACHVLAGSGLSVSPAGLHDGD